MSPRDLRRAILDAIATADRRGMPLRLDEARRFATLAADDGAVADAAAGLRADDLLERHGPFLTLPGRGDLVALRQRRHLVSARQWPAALRTGRRIARLPFVRMVAVTGALTVAAADEGMDIELVLVADDARTWTAWAAASLVTWLARARGVGVRADLVLARSRLELPDRSPAAGRALVCLAPVAGFAVHRELVARNSWFAQVLPNAEPLLLTIRDPAPGRLRQLAEEVLGGPELDVLERWARRRRAARVRAGARPTRASAAGGRGMSRLRATVVHDAHAMSDRVPGTETDIR